MHEAGADWVESNGGPVLLLPERLLPEWSGSDDPPPWRTIEATFRYNPEGVATDYDRACEVRDYLGVLEVGDGFGLVLGDEPLPTTWIESIGGGFLVRWDSGEDKAVAQAMSQLSKLTAWDAGPHFNFSVGPLVLFDSAEPGGHILGEQLTISLPPGTYQLHTSSVRSGPEILLRVHRLTKVAT